MVPGDRLLMDIGNKYKTRKALYFIVTDNTGITQTGLTYLSKYYDQFTNVYIRPVARPLFMSKFFSAVNEVDYQKKLRQSDLALDKWWVTQCGWIRLYTTVAMGTAIH